MGTYERANHRTRKGIRDAFWSLYQEKSLDTITVREITDRAGLHRGTFYSYYDHVEDVLIEIENGLLDSMNLRVDRLLDELPTREEVLHRLALDYRVYGKYLDVLLGEKGDASFQERMQAKIRDNLRPILFPEGGFEAEFVLSFLSGGMVQMLKYWRTKCPKVSLEEVLRMMKQMTSEHAMKLYALRNGEVLRSDMDGTYERHRG